MTQKTAVIIGAGPAGLTAAFELLEKTDVKPVIFEQTADIGGISKTVNYKGNRIDIGGHRFFSKSDRVVEWWLKVLPLQTSPAKDDSPENASFLTGGSQRFSAPPGSRNSDPEKTDRVMLARKRLSRILFMRKFFDYPISANMKTLRNLGAFRTAKILVSYFRARLAPVEEKSLEDFFINRFGKELYATFFRDYTEKVWGVPCSEIDPSWGAQRIKGLSVTKALFHAARGMVSDRSLEQKDVETSLIERFMYPKLGPGQMWEEAARMIRKRGGEVHLNHRVAGLKATSGRIYEAVVIDESTGEEKTVLGDYFISSMPVKDLIAAMGHDAPREVREVAGSLAYRDFMTVGLLLKKLLVSPKDAPNGIIPDNWIYVQENDVKLGRIQIFNNWSPYMVMDGGAVWIGLEYFCNEGDELWRKSDDEFATFAGEELEKLGMIVREDILDSTVIRMPKAYPCYFGSYERFEVVRKFTDTIENLFLIGRNGMHRYNNQDHSMLTAMVAAENIKNGISTKENIWSVNAEEEYHESK
ncbi:MAG: NAD(P)/FAD-dependent oxidoreductase [Thermodesulfobacteriota bacterium]|nr:MAG: NAD(P)/FAD-dependent oxidoreductase [Thermodesulfobacteriota bacterium]